MQVQQEQWERQLRERSLSMHGSRSSDSNLRGTALLKKMDPETYEWLRMRHDSPMFAKFGIKDENERRIMFIEAGNCLNKSKQDEIVADALSWCNMLFAAKQDLEAKARQTRSNDASKSDRREDGTAEDTSSKRAKSTKGSSNSDSTHASHSSKGSSGKKEDETKRGKEAERGANTVHATMTIHGTPAQVMDFNNAVRDMRSSKASTDDKGPKIIASHLLSQKAGHQMVKSTIIAIARNCFGMHFDSASDEDVFDKLRDTHETPGATPSFEEAELWAHLCHAADVMRSQIADTNTMQHFHHFAEFSGAGAWHTVHTIIYNRTLAKLGFDPNDKEWNREVKLANTMHASKCKPARGASAGNTKASRGRGFGRGGGRGSRGGGYQSSWQRQYSGGSYRSYGGGYYRSYGGRDIRDSGKGQRSGGEGDGGRKG